MTDKTDILERARREGTPLIDGDVATFVWNGPKAPLLLGDFNNWGWGAEPIKLKKAAPNLWTYTLKLPRDAYIEYIYMQGDQRIPDPFNKRLITNGVDADNNFFAMPEAEHTRLVRLGRGVRRGTVTKHTVSGNNLVVGSQRTVHLYEPAAPGPFPLLVVFDGQDYLRRAKLTTIADNLIAQGRIRPLAMALIEHGKEARFVEYACNEATVGFVMRNVLPLARAQLSLVDVTKTPGAYGVLGASMGGLIALYTAFRLPEIFGHVLSQSGAFGFDLEGHQMVIYDMLRELMLRPLKIWMDVGRYEFLHDANERMHKLLNVRGYDVAYREYPGGHNYTSWRNDVWRGLEALFGTHG